MTRMGKPSGNSRRQQKSSSRKRVTSSSSITEIASPAKTSDKTQKTKKKRSKGIPCFSASEVSQKSNTFLWTIFNKLQPGWQAAERELIRRGQIQEEEVAS